MTAVWLPDVLSDAFRGVRGYQVDTVSGWRTRSAKTTTFEPRGVMNHHTGGGGYAALLNFMTVGSSIAPLSQVATSRPHSIGGIQTVRITIMAAGRCNHAGKGHWSWTGTDGGNRYCIGIENQNDGRQSWPKQQVEGIHIATAAILKHLRQNEQRAIDHKDYAPGRKVDRHSTTRSKEQAAIKVVLQGGVVITPPKPPPPPEDDMPTVKEIVAGFVDASIPLGPAARELYGGRTSQLWRRLVEVAAVHAHRANERSTVNEAKLDQIIDIVADMVDRDPGTPLTKQDILDAIAESVVRVEVGIREKDEAELADEA